MLGRKNRVARRCSVDEVLAHWTHLIESFEFSSQEFYTLVEQALVTRKIPEIKILRMDSPEAGPLSPRREYLRMSWRRYVFDICGAPFGTGFFVSSWFKKEPFAIGLKTVLFLFALSVATYYEPFHLLRRDTRDIVAASIAALGFLAACFLFIADLDAFIGKIPYFGKFYHNYLRRITYYGVDQLASYQAAAQQAVNDVVNEITAKKGIPPLSDSESKPIFNRLLVR